MRRIVLAGFCAVMLASAPPAQETEERPTFTVPVTSDFEDPVYRPFFEDAAERLIGRLGKGVLAVNATHEPGSGRIAGYNMNQDGAVVVAVDVTARAVVRPEGNMVYGGGLVIRREGGTFYALLTDGAHYLFTAWVGGTVTQRLSGTLPERDETAPVRLELREAGAGVELFVDGESFGRVSDSRVEGENAGLAVFGTGSYTFDNFYFTTQSAD
jgi:hypothetical protein